MSRLETAAKPILIDLMDGVRPLSSLTRAEARILSKWAAKTAYLHAWASPMRRPVQLEHLHSLSGDAGHLADYVCVFAKQAAFVQPTSYVQTWFWPQVGTALVKENGESPDEAYKLGLQLRHLYLLVAYWPVPTSELALVRGEHVPIHPAEPREWWTYDAVLPVGDGEIDRLLTFCNALAVRSQG